MDSYRFREGNATEFGEVLDAEEEERKEKKGSEGVEDLERPNVLGVKEARKEAEAIDVCLREKEIREKDRERSN